MKVNIHFYFSALPTANQEAVGLLGSFHEEFVGIFFAAVRKLIVDGLEVPVAARRVGHDTVCVGPNYGWNHGHFLHEKTQGQIAMSRVGDNFIDQLLIHFSPLLVHVLHCPIALHKLSLN